MIFYMPDPMDLLQDIKTSKKKTINLPSGGLLNLEILDNQQARVVAIVSTDPMDYMNENIQPGSILNINYVPEG